MAHIAFEQTRCTRSLWLQGCRQQKVHGMRLRTSRCSVVRVETRGFYRCICRTCDGKAHNLLINLNPICRISLHLVVDAIFLSLIKRQAVSLRSTMSHRKNPTRVKLTDGEQFYNCAPSKAQLFFSVNSDAGRE